MIHTRADLDDRRSAAGLPNHADRILASRPRLRPGESVISLIARASRLNDTPLPRLVDWLDLPPDNAGLRALLRGSGDVTQRVASALILPLARLESATLSHFALVNALQVQRRGGTQAYWGRKGPVRLDTVAESRFKPPALVHLDQVPFCGLCVDEAPDRVLLAQHVALQPVCVRHEMIWANRCGRCAGPGVTLQGLLQNPGRCADCHADLRRTTQLSVRHVDGLLEASTLVGSWLAVPDSQDASEALALLIDHLIAGLISDHPAARSASSAPIRAEVIQARSACQSRTTRSAEVAHLPVPRLIAHYLPAAVESVQNWDPGQFSLPLATTDRSSETEAIRNYTGSRFSSVLKTRSRYLPRWLHQGTDWRFELPEIERASGPKADHVPELLPQELYDGRLSDLIDPAMNGLGWPKVIEIRLAIATYFAGHTVWQSDDDWVVTCWEKCSGLRSEHVLAVVATRVLDHHLDRDLWTDALREAYVTLHGLAIDWEHRRAILNDPAAIDRILATAGTTETLESKRWLHEVWACAVDQTLGLYGSDTYLLDPRQESNSDIVSILRAAADAEQDRQADAWARDRAMQPGVVA